MIGISTFGKQRQRVRHKLRAGSFENRQECLRELDAETIVVRNPGLAAVTTAEKAATVWQ